MTYEIKIPANPADSGIYTLEATLPGNARVRTLVWEESGNGWAWRLVSLTNGKPTKAPMSWRQVLETFDNVREPADPVREARTEIADELGVIHGEYMERFGASTSDPDSSVAGQSLANRLGDLIARLRK